MFEKLKEMLMDQIDVEEEKVTLDAKIIDDLGADSLDVFELLMALEEEYSVEIPAEEAENMSTLGDLIEYMKAHGVEE